MFVESGRKKLEEAPLILKNDIKPDFEELSLLGARIV